MRISDWSSDVCSSDLGGWYAFPGGEGPLANAEPAANATNPPGPGDIYSIPQNLIYAVNGVQRQRTNGQATLQWAPTDRNTTTLDYTYAENKIQARRHELSTWFHQAADRKSTRLNSRYYYAPRS